MQLKSSYHKALSQLAQVDQKRRDSYTNFLQDCGKLESHCIIQNNAVPSIINCVKDHPRSWMPVISRRNSFSSSSGNKLSKSLGPKTYFTDSSSRTCSQQPVKTRSRSIFDKNNISWAITKTVPIISQAAAAAANVAQSVGTILNHAVVPPDTTPKVSPYNSVMKFFNAGDIQIFQRIFQTNYWVENEIKPIKDLVKPTGNNVSGLWQIIEPYSQKETKQKHLEKVFKKGHKVVTRQKWNRLLPDISKELWNFAHISHVELSIFSVENVPYITQIVIETNQLRVALPFNCMFVRVPVTRENELITLWFNSPVTCSQRHERIDPEDPYYDWLDAEQSENFLSINEDLYTEEQLQDLTDSHIHPKSLHYFNAPQGAYTPEHDYPVYFKFQIPVSSSLQLERSALLDPKNCFYECNADQWPQTNFIRLLHGTRQSGRQPTVKFRVVLNLQGAHKLVRSNQDRTSHPNPNESYYKQELVYVALHNDPLDQLVSLELNRNEYELMKTLGERNIIRIKEGFYVIYGKEVRMESMMITPKSFPDFNFQQYAHVDGNTVFKNKFYLPVVIYEGIMQPLPDFIIKSNLNKRYIDNTEEEDIRMSYKQYIPDLKLTTETFNLPYEAMNNPEVFYTLYRHAQAIMKNLVRMFSNNKINKLTMKDIENLQPPLVQLSPNSINRTPVTFSWNIYDVEAGIELVNVDTSKNPYGGIFYLNGKGHIPSALQSVYNLHLAEQKPKPKVVPETEYYQNVHYNVKIPYSNFSNINL